MSQYYHATTLSWRVARIGGVLRSMLMFVCGAVVLVGAALMLEPNALQAVGGHTLAPAPVHSSQRTHDEFAETLSTLIANCKEILALNNHQPNAQASIVLWVKDDENLGVIDPEEIAVISHSQLLRTVTAYSMEKRGTRSEAASAEAGSSSKPATTSAIRAQTLDRGVVTGTPRYGRPAALRLGGPLDRTAISAPVFCDRWRATPSVQPKTIGTGISDMRVEPVSGEAADFSVLRLWLRWSADSADGAGEATALIQHQKE